MSDLIADPKLTAYALGELNESDASEIERRLATDEAARAEVESIRALANQLTSELHEAEEPTPEPIPLHRQPQWAGRLAIAAAACVVLGTSVGVALLHHPRSQATGF